jgi:catechol 2,3-dioxygenase-like lactoylglutathione lyase family enzyme
MTADSTPDASSHGARGGAARHGVFKAVTVNHISYQSADFEKLRDFYADVLGMKVYHHTSHTGQQQTWLGFGDSYIIPRTSTRADMKPPLVDHIAFTIANWNTRAVEAELRRRSLDPRPDTDDSFIVRDPDGFMLQISGSNMKP